MDEFTIYCTEEQTKKALELGAPIETLDTEVEIENRNIGYTVGYEGFLCQPAKLETYLYDDDGNRNEWCAILEGTEETGRIVVYTPTTEQMIGFLRSKGIKFHFDDETNYWRVDTSVWPISISHGVSEKKEHAAIDAALEYLSTKK
ncbi:MAG: hypothetical protein KBT27_04255 [Prevotellaceae bacterium]|nr:hypothetical protein [Candidatus Faecinaster equi]